MKEKAIIFFALLNESYKVEAEERLEEIAIMSIPYMEKDNAKEIIDRYELQSGRILESLEPYNDYSGIQKLNKALQKT